MMRKSLTKLVAGAAALAVSGVALTAIAGEPGSQNAVHVMNVALPDGSIAQMRYVGDTPPSLVIAPAAPVAFIDPFGGDPFGGDPFAAMDRVFAAMDHEQAAMMSEVQQMVSSGPETLVPAAFGHLPAGAQGYVVVSTFGTGGACTRSMSITSASDGEAPLLRTSDHGDCGPGTAIGGTRAPVQAAQPVAPRAPLPLVTASARGHAPYREMVRPVADWAG